MVEEQLAIEKLALFFYFSFMDESRARESTSQCLRRIRNRIGENKSANWEALLVEESFKAIRTKKEFGTLSRVGFVQGHVKFPAGSNWGPWFEYRKSADAESFCTLIWVKVLSASVEAVAEGLNVSVGTIRHRLAKSLLELGESLPAGVNS